MTDPAERDYRQCVAEIFDIPPHLLDPVHNLGDARKQDKDVVTQRMLRRLRRIKEEVRQMGFKKFGSGDGQVTETEGSLAKTAANAEFTEADAEALRRENAAADTPKEED